MKTPMQELIARLESLIELAEGTLYAGVLKSVKLQAESMLEKEKEVMCGIQWNKYPETKPKLTGEYLVMHKDEGLCLVSASKKSQFGLEGLRITHFAFVNLPNQ